jgi:hypothetical protein
VVKYSVDQVKLGRTVLEDEVKTATRRLPLDDINGRILTYLSREPFLTVHSIAQVLGLPPVTVCWRMTMSLGMKPRYFQ